MEFLPVLWMQNPQVGANGVPRVTENIEKARECLDAAVQQLETVGQRTCPDPMVDEALGNLYEATELLDGKS